MANDPLQNAMLITERMATLIVKDQIGISAYKTGNLQRSVSVIGQRTGDIVALVLNDPTSYGDFTDFGTRSYRASESGPFNPNPGKGQGGIIPRFWSSLNDGQLERLQMIFEEEFDKEIEKEIDL